MFKKYYTKTDKLTAIHLNNTVYKIIIVGCARDCAQYLPEVLHNIKLLSKNKDVYYIFYENDSVDNTKELLQTFIDKSKNGKLISEKNVKIPLRTHRIAHGRNTILDFIYTNNLHKKYTYYLNMDLDNVNQYIDIDSVNKCLSENNNWDIASINQTNQYYDLWALRTKFKNNNCWYKDICVNHDMSDWFKYISLINEKKISLDFGYLPVLSAFGGLTIYKIKFLNNCFYSGINKDDLSKEECEHVPFHKCILNKYPNIRFYIISYMTNSGYSWLN